MQKKAVIYCRTACTPADGNDLPAQKQEGLCRNYILTHGYKEAGMFSDLGVSGMTNERSSLKSMLEFLKKEDAPCTVVVASHDRLGRDAPSLGQLLKELANVNAELVTVDTKEKGK